MKKSSKSLTFAIEQKVVYPLQGVGKVTDIQEKTFKDKKTLYYIIYIEASDMTVMVPVNKAESIGVRAIVAQKKSKDALTLISQPYEPVEADWKTRYQMNLDLLKKGDIKDIAEVVRALYHRSQVKELPIMERKLFDNALKLFIDEISYSLSISKTESEQIIHSKLEAY